MMQAATLSWAAPLPAASCPGRCCCCCRCPRCRPLSSFPCRAGRLGTQAARQTCQPRCTAGPCAACGGTAAPPVSRGEHEACPVCDARVKQPQARLAPALQVALHAPPIAKLNGGHLRRPRRMLLCPAGTHLQTGRLWNGQLWLLRRRHDCLVHRGAGLGWVRHRQLHCQLAAGLANLLCLQHRARGVAVQRRRSEAGPACCRAAADVRYACQAVRCSAARGRAKQQDPRGARGLWASPDGSWSRAAAGLAVVCLPSVSGTAHGRRPST